jgi:RNA polymerase sigma-70 factor (ECF subfamily)
MKEEDPNTVHEWLKHAAAGDAECWRRLLEPHHARLRRMVAGRMDSRLQGRVDPSDVLQNAYVEAIRQLNKYLDNETLPFFVWLRGLVGSQLARTHRQHLGTQQRDAGREVPLDQPAPDMSSAVLAQCLLGESERPSEEAVRAELRERLQILLERLSAADREVLALRHFEQLNTAETAAVLGISTSATGKRYIRALDRLRDQLTDYPEILEGWRP